VYSSSAIHTVRRLGQRVHVSGSDHLAPVGAIAACNACCDVTFSAPLFPIFKVSHK
jgi:hypothetical protein